MSAEDFQDGFSLPKVCAVSGEGADRLFAYEATESLSTSARFLALSAGPIGMMLASSRPSCKGWIPLSGDAARRLLRLRRARFAVIIGYLLVMLALFMGALDRLANVAGLPGFAVGLAAIVAFGWYVERQQVGAELWGNDVVLRGVHENFVQAVGER